MKPMEAYRRIKAGEKVEGYDLRGNVLNDGKHFWQIQTDGYRVQVREVPDPDTLPYIEHRKKEEYPLRFKRICERCGGEFVLTKYSAQRTMCTPCERQWRQDMGIDREKICIRCGKNFFISKYRPYSDPQHCPKCANILRVQAGHKKKAEAQKMGLPLQGEGLPCTREGSDAL